MSSLIDNNINGNTQYVISEKTEIKCYVYYIVLDDLSNRLKKVLVKKYFHL